MPLFVTVTPGTTVTSSTTLDASTLNLLGTPSVDVSGTVDGGSITLGVQSVPLPSLYYQADQTIVGNGSEASASPVALTTTDLVLTATTVNIKALAVTAAKIATNTITADKLLQVDGTTPKILGRFTAGTGNYETNLSVGSNLTTSGNTLNALRPAVASTTVLDPSSYAVPTARATPQEITALTTSITTQTATSKVLVTFNISYSISAFSDQACRYAFILTKSIGGGADTEVAIPSSPLTNQIYGIKALDPIFYTYQQNTACIQFLDSPGSAAVVTYKLKIYGSAQSPAATTQFFINRTTGDAAQNYVTRATSQVILQEILP